MERVTVIRPSRDPSRAGPSGPPPPASQPLSADEIFRWLEEGRIAPPQAVEQLGKLERSPRGGTADGERERQREIEAALGELDALVGLDQVKQVIREIHAYVMVRQRRARVGLINEPLTLHMVFVGNPGTGKTTLARILGRLFRALGVLEKGHLVEVERADLVGEYIGHTAQKTREQIKKAMGGILFIDEAYALARGGEKDFGKEAIDTLVKSMEDHKNDFILILAGYKDEMEGFLLTNPGLRSRFPIHIDFPDYTVEELLQIAHHMLRERQYRLSAAARERLAQILRRRLSHRDPNAGNARMVRNIIERAIRRQAVRLVKKRRNSREELMVIEEADLEEVTAE